MKYLKSTDFFSIDCSTNTIGLSDTDKLLAYIKVSNYRYIIGLGIYSIKNKVLKIERKAKNKFRNMKAIDEAPNFYDIGEFINVEGTGTNFLNSEKMGNSWCNMTSFVIRNCINTNKLSTLNGFIHIPNVPNNIAVYTRTIQNVLDSIKSSN